MGTFTIQALTGIAAVIAAIGAPFVYFGTLERANAVQDVKISTVESGIAKMQDDVEYIRRAVEQISIKQGIQGVQGIQGATGAQGVQGVRGAPGVDASTP